jgi:trimethylamine:corrinoid methyltransferase-like protein
MTQANAANAAAILAAEQAAALALQQALAALPPAGAPLDFGYSLWQFDMKSVRMLTHT